MKFSMDNAGGGYVIRAYGAGQITIAYPPSLASGNVVPMVHMQPDRPVMIEENLTASIIIAPQHLVRDWPPHSFDDLTAPHLTQLIEFDPEMVLLGTGSRVRFPKQAWLAEFYQRGIGVEIMDTNAACRTYNILMAEGRNFVAGLLANG